MFKKKLKHSTEVCLKLVHILGYSLSSREDKNYFCHQKIINLPRGHLIACDHPNDKKIIRRRRKLKKIEKQRQGQRKKSKRMTRKTHKANIDQLRDNERTPFGKLNPITNLGRDLMSALKREFNPSGKSHCSYSNYS